MSCYSKKACTQNLDELLKKLDDLEQKLYAYSYGMSQINFAGETQDPKNAAADRGMALSLLGMLSQELLVSPQTHELLLELEKHQDKLDETRKAQLKVLLREYKRNADIPLQENAEFARLVNEANDVWHRAKDADDWESFAPYLDQIVTTLKKFASIMDPTKDAYNVWLDYYEPGASTEFYDTFFAKLKKTIVPLVDAIQKKNEQPSKAMFEKTFDIEKQKLFTHDLAEFEGLTMDALVIEESLHPFTDSVSSNHAFITTHYYENDLMSNVYSTLHEGGHALYEQRVNPAYNYTSLRGGTSMGIHESISRFFENIVGRSQNYAPHLLELARKQFPTELEGVTADDWYKAVNIATPSLIRIEADELTYCLHIIVRYEIERDLFAGTITAQDVPRVWAEKYKEYLGIDVPNNSLGALQDTHWSGGALGYFPTYALGSAYGAQYVHAMKKAGIDVDACIASGDTSEILEWLTDNILVYGHAKDPKELIANACSEGFDARYYCDYLEHKFKKLYQLD